MKDYSDIIKSLEVCSKKWKTFCNGCTYCTGLDVDPSCDETLMQKAAEALKELTEGHEDDLK